MDLRGQAVLDGEDRRADSRAARLLPRDSDSHERNLARSLQRRGRDEDGRRLGRGRPRALAMRARRPGLARARHLVD